MFSSRPASTSMKETRLPLRCSVRHRSFTRPREKVALPAPITVIFKLRFARVTYLCPFYPLSSPKTRHGGLIPVARECYNRHLGETSACCVIHVVAAARLRPSRLCCQARCAHWC